MTGGAHLFARRRSLSNDNSIRKSHLVELAEYERRQFAADFWPQCVPTLRSAAWPIASLHGSLRVANLRLMHNKMRPAPGLTAEHCCPISVLQASRTATIFMSAAWQGSLKSWKCVLTHSVSGFDPGWLVAQSVVMSRVHFCMTGTY
jgi:hypothetical protein